MIRAAAFKRLWRRTVWRFQSTLTFRMTLFYGALFVAVSMLSLFGTRKAIESYAESQIRREMTVGSALFDRIAAMQFHQLAQAGNVLASDFGFREAVGTSDAATIASALQSLQGRFKIDDAMFVGIDGAVAGGAVGLSAEDQTQLFDALDAGRERGIVRWRGQSHMVAHRRGDADGLGRVRAQYGTGGPPATRQALLDRPASATRAADPRRGTRRRGSGGRSRRRTHPQLGASGARAGGGCAATAGAGI